MPLKNASGQRKRPMFVEHGIKPQSFVGFSREAESFGCGVLSSKLLKTGFFLYYFSIKFGLFLMNLNRIMEVLYLLVGYSEKKTFFLGA